MAEEGYKSNGSPHGFSISQIDELYRAQQRKREIVESIFTALAEHELLFKRGFEWHYSGMSREELFKRLKEGYGVSEEEFQNIIQWLIRKGDIYEPRPNYLRRC